MLLILCYYGSTDREADKRKHHRYKDTIPIFPENRKTVTKKIVTLAQGSCLAFLL